MPSACALGMFKGILFKIWVNYAVTDQTLKILLPMRLTPFHEKGRCGKWQLPQKSSYF